MTLSMYQASIPSFIRMLGNLSDIMTKAEDYAESKKIDPSVLINARLAPDMFPLSRQIQIATDSVKGCGARLAGVDVPSYPDTESTFAELQARIRKTVDFLKTFKPEQIDGSEGRDILLKMRTGDLTFQGQAYLTHFVLPNFYFHTSMAYAILRHNGLDIGKMDFLGKPE